VVRRLKNASANTAVNIGVAPFSSPATAELMCCSARGNSVKGTPTQITDTASMRGRSSGRRCTREPGSRPKVSAPRPTRTTVTTPGSRLSRPTAMNRNDAPQMSPMAEKTAQSDCENAAVVPPGAVGAEGTTAPDDSGGPTSPAGAGSMSPIERRREFKPAVLEVRAAREFVADALATAGYQGDVDDVLLLVSELATNAVRHARTRFDLIIDARREGVRVTVVDDAGEQAPRVGQPTPDDTAGRGLLIVDRLAETWGSTVVGPGRKAVWFTLP